jgi:hypothetical protein
MAAVEERLAAVERELRELSALAAQMCEDLRMLRVKEDSYLRLAGQLADALEAMYCLSPSRNRGRLRHLHLTADPADPEGDAR